MKQRSILRDASIKGKALHTGEEVNLTIKPAPANHGIVFRRVDLYGKPEIKPEVSFVSDLVRSTTISSGHTKIHTIEHVLSALSGMAIDNCVIEMDASEPPILDGSAKHFVNLIQEAEPIEQDAEREYLTLTEPVSVTNGSSSLIALPYDGLKVTCTSADDRGTHTQHVSLEIDPESYSAQVAPARTFTIYEDIEELLKLGKIQGGSLDSAIVIKGDKILSKEPLRYKDEFARHKVLDVVGDITLLGKPLKAHIVAVRTGHALNAQLCQAILKSLEKPKKKKAKSAKQQVRPDETELDIRRILDTLPHRYPFVMLDRVIEIAENGDSLTAVKNVTINEPYFLGHFPGQPVMPGVLQVEAMAQAAGILMLRRISSESKIAFFMSCDKVKFRRAVVPGDQIVIEVKLTKNRGNKIGVAAGTCKVDDKIVSSADLMFTIAEAGDM
ncbi:MAG: bifunctional UDP-3-O-[3-hydroxymyristoyl] N-acetylglucosamine deacetylase/3-hydroxyacyl-ACP dehydratase [Verrucomicrobiota bacterium]